MTPVHRRLPPSQFLAGALISLLCLSSGAQAQKIQDDEEKVWQEAAIAPPVVFNAEQLQAFEVKLGSALRYGIDPKTLTIGNDGVVRYVLVARSASGALNVLYQGVRCQTAEVKTYGRWDNGQSRWNTSTSDSWQDLSFSGPSRPAMILAKGGICEGRTVNGPPKKILDTLKNGRPDEVR